jgi:putative membrane protein
MINRFLDHTANERTYLSWISTAIALMAFGFVIERFDIFISYITKMLGGDAHLSKSSYAANVVGIGLVIIAALIITVSTIRFLLYKKAIDSKKALPYGSLKAVISLALLLILLAGFLSYYLWRHIH